MSNARINPILWTHDMTENEYDRFLEEERKFANERARIKRWLDGKKPWQTDLRPKIET